MFSELCRETLRKAAVCYSARAGSPSPSPPTSPPPSPAKEAKTAANADLANVRDASHEGTRDYHQHQHHHHHSGTIAGKRAPPTGNTTGEPKDSEKSTSTDRSNDFREYVYIRKRPAMPTDFSKRLPGLEAREGRRGGTHSAAKSKESRSVSPEKGTARQREDHRGGGGGGSGGGSASSEYGRLDSRLGRRSPGSSPEPEDNSSTSGDEAGAAPEETNQRSSSAHNRHSLTKEQTMHWFAQIGGNDALALTDVKRPRSLYDEDSLDGDRPYENEGRESTGSSKELDRAKLVRERQNEERQRKLEELRQQALAAQRFREQREEERRRRIDELRSRDNDRRNQVEERKRLICEAERERREAILRKNQEREARIEAKKRNERSHIVFAFGSSTPRMLEPADTGGSTFWGTRRATSTTNVMMFPAAQPLTRRSSERELDGSKKRATSAGGLDRKPGEDLVGDVKLTKDSKPPLPKVHSTPKKPSVPKAAEMRKPTDKLIKNARSSPRITPKATPLQSPGVEHVPLIRETNAEIIKQDEGKEAQDVKSEDKNEEKKDQGSEKTQETNIVESVANDTKVTAEPVLASKQVKDETNLMQEISSDAIEEPAKVAKKEDNKQEKKSPEVTEVKLESEGDEQMDMSASMIAKIRITTEEEAKAALAERRRLAREQAEREAELERQRQEEEARLEAERLHAEEEEQRRLEEETIRLANEAREAEEQRLQLAIEEAKRREEEDRRKREEEARQKQEKEEAERKAREEAEKQRIEMAERLKKEEEERNARRKRVEAIMLRTRGKNQSNTSAKGESGDGDKLKEDSPTDESKPVPDGKGDDVMTASLISEATQQFISGEQRAHHTENNVPAPDIVHNGTTHSNGINESKIVLDNNQGNVEGELNGHHTNHGNGINSQSITLDNATVKQNNVTNNLLDLSDFDTLSNNSSGYNTGPILELTPNLANEDTLNSNLNPTAMPFTPIGFVPAAANVNVNPFQDNFINKPQDNNQVPDLLS
ncbi:ensconsin isoform X27 [Cardiocondyla obscurior]|uniref:ensconsin isoform X27 n=1 Tax=Cardiocondyla obscurior TaxID=286306 RepID=UPI0039655AE1